MTADNAQQYRERLTFQKRSDTGYPGDYGEWTDQFTLPARLKPRLTGTENVIAGRMTGQQPYVLTVRMVAAIDAVDESWRIRDARRPNRFFEILSKADVGEDGYQLDFLVREGKPV